MSYCCSGGNAARKVALASSISALLMFGALVYRGEPRAPEPAQVAAPLPASPVIAIDNPSSGTVAVDTNDEDEGKVRRAVNDFLKEKFPNAKAEGMFLLPLTSLGGVYLTISDVTVNETRRPIACQVVRYTRKNGGTYWRALYLSQQQADEYLKLAASK